MRDDIIHTPTVDEAFAQIGLPCPDNINATGVTRYPTNDKKRDTAGYVIMFPDGNGAVLGDFRTGVSGVWQRKINGANKLNAAQRKKLMVQAAQARQQAEAEREAIYAKNANTATNTIHALPEATAENVYLQLKGVQTRRGINRRNLRERSPSCLLLPWMTIDLT